VPLAGSPGPPYSVAPTVCDGPQLAPTDELPAMPPSAASTVRQRPQQKATVSIAAPSSGPPERLLTDLTGAP
jgi:hypothetical protein